MVEVILNDFRKTLFEDFLLSAGFEQ